MQVVRTILFEKSLKKLGATLIDLKKLEAEIASNPSAGDVVQGLSGVRKIRFAMKGRGKRGGGRTIYLVVWSRGIAYLILAYDKAAQSDISETQRKFIQTLVRELSDENGKA